MYQYNVSNKKEYIFITSGKDPGSLVNNTETQGLGIVGFETGNQELDKVIIHVGQRKVFEVKDDTGVVHWMATEEACGFHEVQRTKLHDFKGLVFLAMQLDINKANR